MHALKREHPEMPQKQKVAIALSQARKAGAKIKAKPSREHMLNAMKRRSHKY